MCKISASISSVSMAAQYLCQVCESKLLIGKGYNVAISHAFPVDINITPKELTDLIDKLRAVA